MKKDEMIYGAMVHIVGTKTGACGVTFLEPMQTFDPNSPHRVFPNAVAACVFILEELVRREKEAGITIPAPGVVQWIERTP